MKSSAPIRHVSDTAFWVATYRAEETDRKDALFRDPLAKLLIGDRGGKIADSMTHAARYASWTLVIRTLVIDQLIEKYVSEGYTTVINIGAGLDTRPYRMSFSVPVQWIELDFPHMIQLKNKKLIREIPTCELERIALDLSNHTERQKVFQDLNRRVGPAVILTEGVVPYLSEALVSELALDIKKQPQFRHWIADYYSEKMYPRFQAASFQKRLGDSPFRFFPKNWFGFFIDLGWKAKENCYLFDEGEKVGRRFPLPWPVSLLRYVLRSETLSKAMRLQAFTVFERET